jgi:predicted acetyltransferase
MIVKEIKLMKPTMEYANDIMSFRQEILDVKNSFEGCGSLKNCSSADEWIKILDDMENEETCPKGGVTSNTYIAVRLSDNKVVGIINLRHHINHPILSVWGGHMGYSVRPSERRKGYAKEMLGQNLQNCIDRGLNKVLITCDFDNIESEKTIIANGGVFEKQICVDDNRINRYWIEL